MAKWVLGIFCGFAAMLAFVFLMGEMSSGGKTISPEEVAEILDNLANAANEMKGEEAGPNVVIDGAWVNSGKYLIYRYTVPASLNHINEKIAAEKSAEIVRQACRDRMMRKAFKGGALISYSYRTVGGPELLVIRIDQKICDAA